LLGSGLIFNVTLTIYPMRDNPATGYPLQMPRRTDPQTVIRSQVVLEEHDVSPDGRFAVIVRRFVRGDRYRSHLWLVPLAAGGAPIQLTDGAVRDQLPRVAPDGVSVAFKRTPVIEGGRRGALQRTVDPGADTARLFVLPIQTGGRTGTPWAARTPRRRSVGEIAWSPDGSRLAFTIDAGPARFIQGPTPETGQQPLARRITRIDWRMDETGHVDHWQHLHVVEARRGATPRRLTAGDWGASGIAWAPDGGSIAFVADRGRDADLRPRTSILAVSVPERLAATDAEAPEAEPREVLSLGGHANSPAWSPDGRWLAAIGTLEADALDDVSPGLVVGPADGAAPPWALAPELDRPIGSWIDTDLFGWTASSRTTPAWLDRRTIVAVVSDRGRAAPWRFDVDPSTGRAAGPPGPLVAGDIATHSLALATRENAPHDARVTLLACVGNRPVELVTVPSDGRAPAIRTRFGSRWADGFEWPDMRLIEATGPGGPIDVWVASPAGAEADAPMPTVVDVHGGPLGAWAPAPHLEVVLLCARGYRVLLPNIRGSATYGAAWIRPQLGDWGGVDAADVHAAVDHAVATGLADPARLGVMGLSYGGFMVNWLVGTTDRFKAAVSENGVSNQIAGWAGSDTGVEYNRMSLLGSPTEPGGAEKLWQQSPLRNVASVHTPLLMLQAEADRRCPASDNEHLFIALRVLEKTVEYVLYPEESHVYASAGRPDRRIDRMNRVLDWFDRYLRA
jgi:dipeptidyl aminopeptidase/acylaminoacyl peptidase